MAICITIPGLIIIFFRGIGINICDFITQKRIGSEYRFKVFVADFIDVPIGEVEAIRFSYFELALLVHPDAGFVSIGVNDLDRLEFPDHLLGDANAGAGYGLVLPFHGKPVVIEAFGKAGQQNEDTHGQQNAVTCG